MSEGAPDPQTVHAIVSGMVQGVGFRYFVVQHARRLGLAGRVCNLPDGRVEIRARGPRADLETLVGSLRLGPAMSRVTDVRVEWGVPCPATDGFEVGF